MICPMVADMMRRYYGDGMGHPPITELQYQCSGKACAWWFGAQECCSIAAIANSLHK